MQQIVLIPALRRQATGYNESVEPSVRNCGLQPDLLGQIQQRLTVAVLNVVQGNTAKTQISDGLEVLANYAVAWDGVTRRVQRP